VLQLLVLALFSWRVLMFGSVCFVLVCISMDFYSSKFSRATADLEVNSDAKVANRVQR
jgi:hypothetical protein